MSAIVDAEAASRLIGRIYDCVTDTREWPQALEALREEIGLANAALELLELPTGRFLLRVATGITPGWLSRADDYSAEIVELWGGTQRMLGYALGEPICCSDISDAEIIARNRYYLEWARPQGLIDAVAIPVARQSDMVGSVGCGMTAPLMEPQRAMLRLLGPHFRRALTISKLLDMRSLVTAAFEATLDGVSLGIALVDADLGIVHVNAAASSMMRDGDVIADVGGRLAMPHPVIAVGLADAVCRAAHGAIDLGQRGIAIPARRRDGSPAVIHVLPLGAKARTAILAPRAVAAVFVAPAPMPPQMPAAALALHYDLTPAETRVLELIVEGRSPAEIGTALGVSLSTVKTHLARVFDKTGAHRQADLVRLVSSLSLPV